MKIQLPDRRRATATLFIMPAFILPAIVVTLPALSLLYYAFTKWSGLGAARFNGLENFRRMLFEDSAFHLALFNNLLYMLFFLTLPIMMGFTVAQLVRKVRGRLQMVFRSLFFLPYSISAVVAGQIFSMLYSPYQGLGRLFEVLGIRALAGVAVFGDVNLALYAVASVNFWYWWGFVMVLFLAALHQVDPHLYEVADMEGVSSFQRLVYITIPQIMPTIVTLVMITVIGSFLTFDWVWATTRGGPAGATELASTWIYKRVFVAYDAGYGSALSLTVCVICVVIYLGFATLKRSRLEDV